MINELYELFGEIFENAQYIEDGLSPPALISGQKSRPL